MKYLLLIPFLFSIGTFAQDVEYKYEPVVNKAEYYIGSYKNGKDLDDICLLYTSPSPRDSFRSRMPSSA